MNNQELYNRTMLKDGKMIAKAAVLYVQDRSEPLLCDFCDNRRQVVSISTLGKDTLCICRDCIRAIQGLFSEDL